MIPFLDLKSQYAAIGPDLEAAVLNVMRSGEFVLGRAVSSFETNFAEFCGARHCVALNTGTSALHLALLALGVGPDDDVITVPMTFVATVSAIRYANATPVLVDIDPETWTMDPKALEAAITPRTKAIVPVHLHGRLADMTAILEIAARHGIPVIEDAAQAHGATRADGKRAGTLGKIGCFSFYPGKNLGACGEGGAIVTDDDELAMLVRQLRDWGQTRKYHHERHGFNYRMDGIQGAVLDVKLRHLEDWTNRRRAAAANYDRLLDEGIARPVTPHGLEHVYHVYAIRTPERARVEGELKAAGVATNIHYPIPVHMQPAFASLGYRAGDFPVSERLASETLSLPMFPELTIEQQQVVATAVNRAMGARGPAVRAA